MQLDKVDSNKVDSTQRLLCICTGSSSSCLQWITYWLTRRTPRDVRGVLMVFHGIVCLQSMWLHCTWLDHGAPTMYCSRTCACCYASRHLTRRRLCSTFMITPRVHFVGALWAIAPTRTEIQRESSFTDCFHATKLQRKTSQRNWHE